MNTTGLTKSQAEFFRMVWVAAQRISKETGVPPEVTTAQAIIETGWGKSTIGNNIFGIKAGASWKGKKQLITTHEWDGTKNVKVQAWFRDYDSIEDSLKDHDAFLKGHRYRWCFTKPYFYRDQTELEKVVARFPNADDPKRFEAIQRIVRQMTLLGGPVPYWMHFAQRMHEAGYATDPKYSRMIIDFIRKRFV